MSMKGALDKIVKIGGKELLSIYDVGDIIRAVGEMVQAVNGAIFLHADQTAMDAVGVLDRIRELAMASRRAWDQLEELEREGYERYEKHYEEARKARKRIIESFKRLPSLPEPHVPYGITALLEIAERCSRLDEKQMSALVALAVALKADREIVG